LKAENVFENYLYLWLLNEDMRIGSILLLIIIIIGALLVGKGMTGMVISQSCCFPPNCSAENVCDSAKVPVQYYGLDINKMSLYSGSLLFIFGISAYGLIYRKKASSKYHSP